MLNYLNKNHKNNKGFSMIELLVGMAITVTTTTIVLAIVMSAFRISSKAAVADNARQNGNYAVNRMIKMIQFADSYNGGTTNTGNGAGLGTLSTTCLGNIYKAINITYNNEEKVLQCRGGNSIYLVSDRDDRSKDEELINSRGIAVSECSFTCLSVRGATSPVITIKFDLKVGNDSTAIEKRTSIIPFRTSVKMRNRNN